MNKYIHTFLALCICLNILGCATVRIPDFKVYVTLPYSGDGKWVKTISTEEGRIPKSEWDLLKKRGLVILSEDWQVLRYTLMKNCLTNSCKDTVGVFDGLFYTLDSALKEVQPNPVK